MNCHIWLVSLKTLITDQLLIFSFMEELLSELEKIFSSCLICIMYHRMWVCFPRSVVFTNDTSIEVYISVFLSPALDSLMPGMGWQLLILSNSHNASRWDYLKQNFNCVTYLLKNLPWFLDAIKIIQKLSSL